MAKGEKVHLSFYEYTDPYTEVKVTRLTEPTAINHHMYFYNNMTTQDGKKILYASMTEEGRQLYLMDIENQESTQLTEGSGIDDYYAFLSKDDRYVFYQQGQRFIRLDLCTERETCYYETPEGWKIGDVGSSEDNRYVVVTEVKRDTIPVATKANWDFFRVNCLAKPLCRIVYIDVENQTSHIVLEDHCWMGHPQIRPQDPETILFCHEGPYDLIDARLWLVQRDGSNLRCCREQPKNLILTHEYWLKDGSKFAFVYREVEGDKEEIRFINPDTLQEEVLMTCSTYAHFISNKENTLLVGDAQGNRKLIHQLTEDQDDEVKNDFIYLINPIDKKEEKLCYHGTSWRGDYGSPQDSHPHPCFSNNGKYVLFVSDQHGLPSIYKVELNQK